MARKAAGRRRPPASSRKAPPPRRSVSGAADPDIRQRIVDAALDLAAERGWAGLGLADIAAAAGVGLADLHGQFGSKAAILRTFFRSVDGAVLAGPAPADEPARDRLFEVLMRRFDALASRKAAVAAVVRDLPADPPAALCALAHLGCSMAWMLEAAGIPSAGLMGLARAKGLSFVWLNALRVWLNDDTPDLARTMAALDKGLRRAEAVAGLCRFGPRQGRGDEAAAGAAA
jgi:AcrR family transcriptional regulator